MDYKAGYMQLKRNWKKDLKKLPTLQQREAKGVEFIKERLRDMEDRICLTRVPEWEKEWARGKNQRHEFRTPVRKYESINRGSATYKECK